MSGFDQLNPMQREAVQTVSEPVLVLAGAGSGKTRALTHRIAWLVGEGVDPWNILAITFTNKAADEMRERVDGMMAAGAERVWISTFHSMCVRILRRHIEPLGFGTDFTVYDSDDQRTLMRRVIKSLEKDIKQYRERGMLSIVSDCKNRLITPEEYAEDAAGDFRRRQYAEIYTEYQAQLRRNNALDFDDLIMKTVELFRTQPEVLTYYQNRFRYIMVDEYQDTNAAQFELISLLARRDRNIWVVGDDDQSIYRFRGADIRNILEFEQVFPGAKVIRLEQNYRSTGNILRAANAVISHNLSRKGKTLWTKNEDGGQIEVRCFETAQEEAAYIMRQVREYVENGGSYRDCAVLYRTNAQTRLLEEAADLCLGQHYRTLGVSFYDRREIRDMVAYLRTVSNGKDDLAVARIINVPRRGIGAASLNRLILYAGINGCSLYEVCGKAREIGGLSKAAPGIERFVREIETLRQMAKEMSIVELIDSILTVTGYREYLMEEDDVQAEDRLEYIGALKDKAAYYEDGTDSPSLSEFLEDIPLHSDQDDLDRDEDKMVLMTLHSAKGLEFPVVFMAGMEDGLFPSYQSINSDDPESAIEEERRLCYVGITRAQKRLVMTAAQKRMVNGENRCFTLSRFVQELPPGAATVTGGDGSSERLPRYMSGGFSYMRRDFGGGSRFSRTEAFPGERVFDLDTGTYETPGRTGGFSGRAEKSASRGGFSGGGISVGSRLTQGAGVPDYGPGDRVAHVKFGEGTVLSVEKRERDYEVTVNFDRAGQKRMYAAFAKLKKL